MHIHISTYSLLNNALLYGWTGFQRIVYNSFQIDGLCPAVSAIARNDDVAGGIIDPVFQRSGRKPGKDNGMDGPNTGACQTGNGQLWSHWHVKTDPISFFSAIAFKHVGESTNAAVQFFVSDLLGRFIRVVRFEQNGHLVSSGCEMPVQTIFRDVQFSAQKPLYRWGFKLPFQGFVPLLFPVECFCFLTPESFWIGNTFTVLLMIFL